MRINEPIEVTADHIGAPLAFTWRHIRYAVVAEPERWFAKVAWWREQQSQLERTLWRVSALPCSGPRSLRTAAPEEGVYDLCVEPVQVTTGSVALRWVLSEAHTEQLDNQLFA